MVLLLPKHVLRLNLGSKLGRETQKCTYVVETETEKNVVGEIHARFVDQRLRHGRLLVFNLEDEKISIVKELQQQRK